LFTATIEFHKNSPKINENEIGIVTRRTQNKLAYWKRWYKNFFRKLKIELMC